MASSGERTSWDELMEGLPKPSKKRKKIHGRHKLSIGTATIRSDINVTPLVDVVLVLLIIFMVVTPLITRGKPVQMPITEHHDRKNDSGEQIVVSITCDGGKMGPTRFECASFSTYVATEQANGDALKEQLQQEMRKSPGREVHIKADKRLNWGPVRETMQRINETGIPNVALGSREKVEE